MGNDYIGREIKCSDLRIAGTRRQFRNDDLWQIVLNLLYVKNSIGLGESIAFVPADRDRLRLAKRLPFECR